MTHANDDKLGWNIYNQKVIIACIKRHFTHLKSVSLRHKRNKMNILQIVLVLINCSTCDAFQSLDDLEKFYKTGPAFDPFGISGYFYSSKVDSLTVKLWLWEKDSDAQHGHRSLRKKLKTSY